MDCLDTIHSRRSIRHYTEQDVTDAELEVVLRAAMAAPSAGNQQSWRFVIVRDFAQRERLSVATPYSQMIARAPVALVVCADTRIEKHPGYWVQDCSAAIQNALLAITETGLGAVWIGVHPVEERVANVAAVIECPAGIVPMSMIAIGHPAEEKPRVDRFMPEYLYNERWDG